MGIYSRIHPSSNGDGTSGYEEAGAQGLVAGINAALNVTAKPEMVLTRADGYIGVLIDDLITKSTDEPYRMFTSRAEYRLQLRQDNADLRLTPIGRRVGLVHDDHWRQFSRKKHQIETELDRLRSTWNNGNTLVDLLRRPEIRYDALPGARRDLPADVREEIEIEVKYQGYIERDVEQIEKFKALESKQLPDWINYEEIRALRHESRQKLIRFRPHSIGQASRISGVTPADIAILLVWLRKSAPLVS